ncbi:MAG: T9SS type A sorting domain-containing protein, partial [Flavobacteriales bacterium]|nr:T9SS type A sorting domain-containing protein [Flavobacteriales bacterium]
SIEDGNNVDLSGYMDNTDAQNLSLSGTTLSIDNGTGVDLSSLQDGTGTDDQTLTLSGNTLSIEDGNNVDLSGYMDNTDAQNLSLSGTTLSIDNGTGVDLSSLQDGTGTDDQTLSLSGTTLSIEDGNNVDLSSLQDGTGTDDQTLTLSGTTLSIEDGNNVDLSSLQDGTGTDDQNLTSATLTGTTLQIDIENGSSVSVDLAPLLTDLYNKISALTDRLDTLEARVTNCCGPTAIDPVNPNGTQPNKSTLLQNIPNPWSQNTQISFYIDKSVKSASLQVFDASGKLVRKVAINTRGYGSVELDSKTFAPGTYMYSLSLDGQQSEALKMVLDR